jgi:hypothetical protein
VDAFVRGYHFAGSLRANNGTYAVHIVLGVQNGHCHVRRVSTVFFLILVCVLQLNDIVIQGTTLYEVTSTYLHEITQLRVEVGESGWLVENEVPDAFETNAPEEMESLTVEQEMRIVVEKQITGTSNFRILRRKH